MASYGTAFEELSDEERDAVKRKPRGTQDEIVTDERGRRRFHGAFTGGFSAGYFNTAGSKEGWTPKTFKSSRENRAERINFGTEDFMDSEDFGEFGIAAKRIRMKSDFMSSISTPGEKNLLAWERSTLGTGAGASTSSGLNTEISSKLMEILKPLNDSIGVRLMRKMGWRAGKGIGPSMSRRALEKQKVIDASGRGEKANFDEEAVREIENVIPDAEFAPVDVEEYHFTPKDNVHGLGYVPLQESGVLSENYGSMAAGLRATRKGKAIRGQAFGVGAFEDDDDDIYTTYDLSQYDFEVGATTSSANQETKRFDYTFVPAKTPPKSLRKFFEAPKPPHGYRPVVKLPPVVVVKNLTDRVAKLAERLTPFERAKFLGERDNSVLELLSDEDRKRLALARESAQSRSLPVVDAKQTRSDGSRHRIQQAEPFEEEPIKNHRFKQFINYLRRGIDFPQPVALTRLEWEKELADFKAALSPDLRALLPEVSSRQKPLAKVEFSQPIAEQLKSRFQSESRAQEDGIMEKSTRQSADHDRVQAVRMKMFGEMTRLKYQWYPSKEVCKRFNVPPPHPGSSLVGVPELQKRRTADYDTAMNFTVVGVNAELGLPNTANEVAARKEREMQEFLTWDSNKDETVPDSSASNPPVIKNEATTESGQSAPFELLRALFEAESSDSDSDSNDEESQKKNGNETFSSVSQPAANQSTEQEKERASIAKTSVMAEKVEKVITVLDLVEDDDVYGPKLPPTSDDDNGVGSSTVIYDVIDSPDSVSRRTRDGAKIATKSSKKHKKEKKESKKSWKKEKNERKKHKKSKKRKKTRSHNSSSSSLSSDGVEILD